MLFFRNASKLAAYRLAPSLQSFFNFYACNSCKIKFYFPILQLLTTVGFFLFPSNDFLSKKY